MKKNIMPLLLFILIVCTTTLSFTPSRKSNAIYESFYVSENENVGVWLEPNDVILKDGTVFAKATKDKGLQLENLSNGYYQIIQKK